ncbi:MAG: TIGR03857 family LLM class F420-dependent oxidoreductase, partial [Actinomycetes bacterium]
QAYGDLMVRTNNWDPALLKCFREDDFVRTFPGALDAKGSTADLERVAPLIPEEWLAPSATGTPQQCVAAIRNQLALGCDGVIMHGATPAELEPIVQAYSS